MVAHAEVIENFAKRKVNRRQGHVTWYAGNVFCEDDTLYSYGSHFPLAKYLGVRDGEPLFIKNGDKYSNSTSSHQSSTNAACPGPTVSRAAMRKAGITFENLTMDTVIATQADRREHCYRNKSTGELFQVAESHRFPTPKVGEFVPYAVVRTTDLFEAGFWHVVGAAVIVHEGESLLCSGDEETYFVTLLPRPAQTVAQAFDMLKPQAVLAAEKAGKCVRRQGEWFFVATDMTDYDFALKAGMGVGAFRRATHPSPLPEKERAEGSNEAVNQHMCRQYFVVNEGIYASGTVRHRNRHGRATGKHRPLVLGDRWWQVHMNTQTESWAG